jgi:DNA primase
MTVEEMEDVLLRLGMDVVSTRGDEIQSFCPAHEERTGHPDRNPSFWINADTGAFICFSCQFKGGVQSLISYAAGIEYEDASGWLTSGEGGLSKKLERAMNRAPKFEEVTEVTESMLSAFVEPPTSILRPRGLSMESTWYYGVKYDPRKDCWIIPIREPLTGKLLGWQEKGAHGRYFNNFPKGMQKSGSLFAYNESMLLDVDTVIVVESPLDVLRLHSVGVMGGVATFGALVSKEQINLLRGAPRLIVAMDHDDAGRASAEMFLQNSARLGFECLFFDYSHTDQKDIGGMSKDEILLGLENAKHSLRGLRAIS